MPRRSSLVLVAVLGLGATSSLPAQSVEAIPMLGMYVPLGPLVDEGALTDTPLRKRHIGTLMLGLRSGLRLGPHVGLEVSLAYTPSMVAVTDAVSTIDHSAGVLLASVRTPFFITGESWVGRWQFHVAPGAGIVARSGQIWSDYEGTTDLAAVMGFGARVGSPTDAIHFRIDVEDYLTWAQFDEPRTTRSLLHHDLLWSMGVSIPVGGR